MGIEKLSRRQMVGMVGAAAALASSNIAIAAPPAKRQAKQPDSEPGVTPPSASLSSIVAPLTTGSQLGAWSVVGVVGARAGAVTVGMRDSAGVEFYVDVCKRDNAGPQPPARTACCDLFIANEGNGSLPTVEDHGLAAMALAEIVQANEQRVDLSGLMTQTQRLAAFGEKVTRGLV